MVGVEFDRRVLVISVARMADALGNSYLIVVLPLYITSRAIRGGTLGLPEPLMIGLVLSTFGLLSSIFQPLTGRLSDSLGRRKLFVLLGLAVLTLTNAAFVFAGSNVSLLLIRAVQGIGVAFAIPVTIALVNEFSTEDTRGSNMGVYNTFRLIGFGIGPVTAGVIIDAGPYAVRGLQMDGFTVAFYVAAVSALVSFLLVWAFVDDPEETGSSAGDDIEVTLLSSDERRVLDPIFALGIASLFMVIAISLISTIQPEINARLNQDATWFGIQFGMFVAAQTIFQTPLGWASDQVGRKLFILAGLIVLIPTTFAQGVVVTPVEMTVVRFLQGTAGAMVFAPSLALAGDLAKRGQSGSQLSILTMAFGLGSAVGPISSGFLIRFGYVVPFVFGAVLAALGAIIVHTQVEETLRG